MDLRKLKTILDLFERSTVSELELSEGEERLRLVKDVHGAVDAKHEPRHQEQVVRQPMEQVEEPAGDTGMEPDEGEGMVRLTSPMVGTFYAQQSAGEAPFVEPGSTVVEGEVVCIIEAMKVFNSISAPASGKVARIAVRNEQPVGFGDLLMVIDTS